MFGTMTWGRQNSEQQGHDQMDYAHEQGINFFDTAELYYSSKARRAESTRVYRDLVQKSGLRDKIILASKIAGPAAFTQHIRTDKSYTKETIDTAVEKSLTTSNRLYRFVPIATEKALQIIFMEERL